MAMLPIRGLSVALLVLGCIGTPERFATAFATGPRWGPSAKRRTRASWSWLTVNARRHNRSRDGSDERASNEREETSLPQLPSIGGSSFGLLPMVESSVVANDIAFVARKIGLQYTCGVCNTRNSHMVSRVAYRSGVVIATCKGCQSRHQIADHLGKGGTIEDYLPVHRVGEDAFQISYLFNSYDTEAGAIVSEDGRMSLE